MKKADKFSFNFNVDDDWRWDIGENQIESIGKMKKKKIATLFCFLQLSPSVAPI